MIETLADRVNADANLVHRGRFIDISFLLEIGDQAWLIRILDGRIIDIRKGPFVMPRWGFALRAAAADWEEFWSPVPPPGYHDLFALIRFKRLKAEGDLQPLMANLFYFKAMLATLRSAA